MNFIWNASGRRELKVEFDAKSLNLSWYTL